MEHIFSKKITRKEFLIKSGSLAGIFIFKDLLFGSEIERYNNTLNSNDGTLPNIIILVWGGVRFSETFGDESGQYIPYLKNCLLPEGSLFLNMYDRNIEFHLPSIMAITTGNKYHFVSEDQDYVAAKYPTIFQYARKKYKDPAHKYWEIGGSFFGISAYCKNEEFGLDTYPCILPYGNVHSSFSEELKGILDPDEELYFKVCSEKNLPYFWDSMAEVYFKFFKKIFKIYKPRIILFNISHVDMAHSAHWAKYVASLKRSDELTWEIWKMIKDDHCYRNNTYLIVTPDHERNRLFNHHWEHIGIMPSHVWAYIYGPNIYKGKIIYNKTKHEDICSTVANIMKFDAKYSKGCILKDAFITL